MPISPDSVAAPEPVSPLEAALPPAPPAPEPAPRSPRGGPGGVALAALSFAVLFAATWLARHFFRLHRPLLFWAQVLAGAAFLALLVPLAWRRIHTRLWSLRSKLILTYLLIGFAPVVLFVTLAGISAYIAAGQFSIHLADSRMHQELDELGVDNLNRLRTLSRVLDLRQQSPDHPSRPAGFNSGRRPSPGRDSGPPRGRQSRRGPGQRPPRPFSQQNDAASAASIITTAQITAETPPETLPDPLRARLHRRFAVYLNGQPFDPIPGLPPQQAAQSNARPPQPGPQSGPQPKTQSSIPHGLPAWAGNLHGRQFRGLVLDTAGSAGPTLYLVAIDQRRTPEGILTAITSLPVDPALLDVIAQGLGRVRLTAFGRSLPGEARTAPRTLRRTSISGGVAPQAATHADFAVLFPSTLDATDWAAGPDHPASVPIEVHSRPSLLYRQLFGSSLGGVITNLIRNGLIALTVLFALIESLALWMALRLSSAITASVSDLYSATQRVDRGEFTHRISVPASRSDRDQLAELSRSFNSMTGSLERLVLEQKEKERMQSELSIAQEVQANLFPHHARSLPTLELHGVCRPARSVSGDYYDFLVFHQKDNDAHRQDENSADTAQPKESGVAIVLGDISGKGISAALLMATLHSAVRAYRFASEDLVYGDSSVAGILSTHVEDGSSSDSGKLFESPGRILALLNRHLYRSTQPEKYATLFLAHYDAATSILTYANAGHLPPVVLSQDGSIRRLDRGGSVVGLIDNMAYDEGRVPLAPGDLLVAFSDGVTEPENDLGEFGEQRLIDLVSSLRNEPLAVISSEVMRALDAWIGPREQPDDITLVLARQL